MDYRRLPCVGLLMYILHNQRLLMLVIRSWLTFAYAWETMIRSYLLFFSFHWGEKLLLYEERFDLEE